MKFRFQCPSCDTKRITFGEEPPLEAVCPICAAGLEAEVNFGNSEWTPIPYDYYIKLRADQIVETLISEISGLDTKALSENIRTSTLANSSFKALSNLIASTVENRKRHEEILSVEHSLNEIGKLKSESTKMEEI